MLRAGPEWGKFRKLQELVLPLVSKKQDVGNFLNVFTFEYYILRLHNAVTLDCQKSQLVRVRPTRCVARENVRLENWDFNEEYSNEN